MYSLKVEMEEERLTTDPDWEARLSPMGIAWRMIPRNHKCVKDHMRPQIMANHKYDDMWASQQAADDELHV